MERRAARQACIQVHRQQCKLVRGQPPPQTGNGAATTDRMVAPSALAKRVRVSSRPSGGTLTTCPGGLHTPWPTSAMCKRRQDPSLCRQHATELPSPRADRLEETPEELPGTRSRSPRGQPGGHVSGGRGQLVTRRGVHRRAPSGLGRTGARQSSVIRDEDARVRGPPRETVAATGTGRNRPASALGPDTPRAPRVGAGRTSKETKVVARRDRRAGSDRMIVHACWNGIHPWRGLGA